MKRSVSLFLLFSFLVLYFSLYIAAGGQVQAASEGEWWLNSVDLIDANPLNNTTTSISDGSASMKMTSPDSGDVFEASMSWTAPGTHYQAGETIEISIQVQVDSYVWHGEDDGYIHMGLNYVSATIAARLDVSDIGYGGVTGRSIYLEDAEGHYAGKVSTDNGKIVIASEGYMVSAQFPSGYQDGEKISLYVTSSGGLARYNYVWQAAPAEEPTRPAETTSPDEPTPTMASEEKMIVLSGKVLGIDGRPMRRMKLDFSAWFDAEAGLLSTDHPDWHLESATDGRGLFKAQIPVPENQEKAVQVMMRGELRCILPDGSETYYIVDFSEEHAKEQILISSWFSVDVNAPEYADADIIPVHRLAAFYHLPLGAWTFGGKEFLPDIFASNVSDLESLAAQSYTYNMLWDAQFVGGYLFDELDKISRRSLRVETNWQQADAESDLTVSHFEPNDLAIRLTKYNSGYDDLARFTILHEYGHFFDLASNNGIYRTVYFRQPGSRHINHGGYMNSSTSDSFLEGFATAYAGVVQLIAGIDQPHLAGAVDLSMAGYYTAWGVNGSEEELAIAVLLYQMLFSFDTPKDYWSVLKADGLDFYAYYESFSHSLNTAGQERLEQLAFAGGLFKMPFGSGRYEFGEPYYDLPVDLSSNDIDKHIGNGVYDRHEEYADLMFMVYENGYVDPSQPLSEYDRDALVIGQAADANRTDRRTTKLQPNSFIYLNSIDGSLPVSLLIAFSYSDGSSSRMLFPVMEEDGIAKVYLGLPGRPVEGTVEISIPGGRTIFAGNLAQLHDRFLGTIGRNTPLATAEVKASDLAADGVIPAAVEGNQEAEGILYIPKPGEIIAGNQRAGEEAIDYDAFSGLDAYGQAISAGPNRWGLGVPDGDAGEISSPGIIRGPMSGLKLTLIIIVLILLAIGAVTVALIVMKPGRKQADRQGYANHPDGLDAFNAFGEQIMPGGNSPPDQQLSGAKFCSNCGSRLESGASFCSDCGQRSEIS